MLFLLSLKMRDSNRIVKVSQKGGSNEEYVKKRYMEVEAGVFCVTRVTGLKVMGGKIWFSVRRKFSTVKA